MPESLILGVNSSDMLRGDFEMKVSNERLASMTLIEAWGPEVACAATELLSLRNAQSEAVAVKALEWHKSHVPSWNGDWHTTSPFIYTVRCADENGWKWSEHSGCGYAPTPESAKAAAQADFDQRIRSALTHPAPPLAVTDEMVERAAERLFAAYNHRLKASHGMSWADIGGNVKATWRNEARATLTAALEAKQ